MQFKTLSVAAALLSTTFAFSCQTTQGKFTVSTQIANAAFAAGGTSTGKSGYPHAFGGSSGGGAQLNFLGADPKCNEKNPKLLEFPVFNNGKVYDKEQKHGTVTTPARVVYLADGKTMCGVMTHVIEDKTTHSGSGDFRVCDQVN